MGDMHQVRLELGNTPGVGVAEGVRADDQPDRAELGLDDSERRNYRRAGNQLKR
jgi:hypothetical protein